MRHVHDGGVVDLPDERRVASARGDLLPAAEHHTPDDGDRHESQGHEGRPERFSHAAAPGLSRASPPARRIRSSADMGVVQRRPLRDTPRPNRSGRARDSTSTAGRSRRRSPARSPSVAVPQAVPRRRRTPSGVGGTRIFTYAGAALMRRRPTDPAPIVFRGDWFSTGRDSSSCC